MRFLILALALAACAPKAKDDVVQDKSLSSTWSRTAGGLELAITLTSVAGGTMTASFGTGGTCQYDIGITWSDPELHDSNAGTISIADGTAIVPWPNLNCQNLEGQWTYAVLVSNQLQLCQQNGCLEFK